MSSNVQSLPSVTTTQSGQERLRSIATHLVLILGALVVLFPIAWMISTSLKAPNQVKQFPPIWIPNPLVWENYVRAVTIFPVPFWTFLWNSVFLSLANVFGSVASCTIVAFAFARLRFRGSRILFLLVLSTMMLPQQVTMIPLFMLFSKLGWINTYKPLIVPQFFANAYYVFLLRQFLHHHPARDGRRSPYRWLWHSRHSVSHHPATGSTRHRHCRHL